MDRYDYRFGANGKFHRISEMDDSYIQNCLKQIKKVQKTWLDVTHEGLCLKDLEKINKPLSKAWLRLMEKSTWKSCRKNWSIVRNKRSAIR